MAEFKGVTLPTKASTEDIVKAFGELQSQLRRTFTGLNEQNVTDLKTNKGVKLFDRSIGGLQAWQDSRVENLDSSERLKLQIYLPGGTNKFRLDSILEAKLRIQLEYFRAWSTSSAVGGASAPTSGASSAADTAAVAAGTSGAGGTGATGSGTANLGANGTGATGSGTAHAHATSTTSVNTGAAEPAAHVHTYDKVATPTGSEEAHTHTGPSHAHTDSGHAHTGPSHDHSVPGHVHGMPHTHTVDIADHEHGIVYGIYISGYKAAGVRVYINTVDRTVALGGPFDTNQDGLDIAPYLAEGWNTIEMSSSQLGRIDAAVWVVPFLRMEE